MQDLIKTNKDQIQKDPNLQELAKKWEVNSFDTQQEPQKVTTQKQQNDEQKNRSITTFKPMHFGYKK